MQAGRVCYGRIPHLQPREDHMHLRIEEDSLGKRSVPADAYYGIQTVRAMENFQITGIPISRFPLFIKALACVKRAAAKANLALGLLDADVAEAVIKATYDVEAGLLDDHFPIDVIQGGAGTSVNMNMNEVLANRALELLGHPRGDYGIVSPLNHVNASQSTNDVVPTAIRLACVWFSEKLVPSIRELSDAFTAKGEEFADVIKMGRTQMQDAVPMTLGSEFKSFGLTVAEDIQRLEDVTALLCEVNLGGTAVGTGINAVEGYSELVCKTLAEETGLPIRPAESLIEATSDAGVYVTLSGVLKRMAVKLSKIANDLRLLSSGPHAGIGEINLPKRQPGSSIMPGKVNPVIPEVVNQVAFQVIGNDLTVTFCAEAGQLQLNAFLPALCFNLFESFEIMANGADTLRRNCVKGITANRDLCLAYVHKSMGIATALAPVLGYESAAAIVKEAEAEGRSIEDVLEDKKLMTREQYRTLLDPSRMLRPKTREELEEEHG